MPGPGRLKEIFGKFFRSFQGRESVNPIQGGHDGYIPKPEIGQLDSCLFFGGFPFLRSVTESPAVADDIFLYILFFFCKISNFQRV